MVEEVINVFIERARMIHCFRIPELFLNHRYSAILDSDREEAKSLASFHFALTTNIKKRQGTLVELTKDIKPLVELLNKVASSPNAVASKYAAQALKLIGAEIPHKLSQQVGYRFGSDIFT